MSGSKTHSPHRNAGRATLVSDFARRCNAAQRAMSLYPADHPLRTSAVADFVQVADQIVAVRPVSLTVRRDRLLLDGCETQPIDSAVQSSRSRC